MWCAQLPVAFLLSFAFRRALQLGVVSKRRILAEAAAILAQQPEQPWPAGRPLAQLAWLLTSSGGAAARARRQKKAAAAAAAAEAKAFHEQMAAARQGRWDTCSGWAGGRQAKGSYEGLDQEP